MSEFLVPFLMADMEEFQALFNKLMQLAYGEDFIPTVKAGSLGDGAWDGYLKSSKTVFALYAPRHFAVSETEKKAEKDFARIVADDISEWVFVYNHRGLHKRIIQCVKRLEREHGIRTQLWGLDNLWEVFQRVAPARRKEFTPHTDEIVRSLSVELGSLPSEAIVLPPLAESQIQVRAAYTEGVELKLRTALDDAGNKLIEDIKLDLHRNDFRSAILKGENLEIWLSGSGLKASRPLRAAAYVLLTDVAVVDAAKGEAAAHRHADEHFQSAVEAFGPNPTLEESERLLALRAKLFFLRNNIEGAVQLAWQLTSHTSLPLQLAILVEAREFDKALQLLNSRAFDPKWADTAIIVFLATGQPERAREILFWSREQSELCFQRCSLQFAKYLTIAAHEILRKDRWALGTALPEQARLKLDEAHTALMPLVAGVISGAPPQNGLIVEALATGVSTAQWLGQIDKRHMYVKALGGVRPIPLSYAKAVRAGYAAAPPDLPERLRQEHGNDPEAQVLAAAIDGLNLGHVPQAVRKLRELLPSLQGGDFVRPACEALLSLASTIDDVETRDEIDAFVEPYLGSESQIIKLRRAARLVRDARLDEAQTLLETIKDDTDANWLQVLSQLRRAQGDLIGSTTALISACKGVPHPGLILSAYYSANEADREDLVEEALMMYLAIQPDDGGALSRLAHLFVDQGRFAEAAIRFAVLARQHPDDHSHALNQATCLRNAGNAEDALAIAEELCSDNQPDLRAIAMRAQLLLELNMPQEAFASLQPFRQTFWENAEFLLAYIHFAYPAEHDEEAGEAFAHLLQLQEQGRVPAGRLHAANLHEFKAMLAARMQSREVVAAEYLRGRIPWLVLDAGADHQPVVAWTVRTGDIICGDTGPRAAYTTIYSTNRFTVTDKGTARSRFVDIECPQAGTGVVLDISAVLTMHKLGLTRQAKEYFGTLVIPSHYIPAFADGTSKIMDQQPSRRVELNHIHELVASGRVQVIGASGISVSATISEECESIGASEGRFCVKHLEHWLRRSGHLPSLAGRESEQLPNEMNVFADSLGASILKGFVRVDLDVLGKLHTIVPLRHLPGRLRMCITSADAELVRQSFMSYEAAGAVRKEHASIMRLLTDEKLFSRMPLPLGTGREVENNTSQMSLWALNCAVRGSRPLYVDDRSLQQALLNEHGSRPSRAFGTDALLTALHATGRLDSATSAKHYLQLMRWRYRFIVPPAELLTQLAMEHLDAPPGRALIDVAHYIHDCIKDFGLRAAPEPTVPPIPLGYEVGVRWSSLLGRFAIRFWLDDNVSEDTAMQFTKWAMLTALPGPSPGFSPYQRKVIAEGTAGVVLGASLGAAALGANSVRANKGVLYIAKLLGLDLQEYHRVVGDFTSALIRK